jgi:hypothetical protein
MRVWRSSRCSGTCTRIQIMCLLSGSFVVCSVHNRYLFGLMITLYLTGLNLAGYSNMPCFCSLTRTTRNFHIISLLNDSTGWKWSSRSVPKPLSSLPNVARKKAWSALLRSDDYDQFNGAVDRACRAYLVAELEITRMDNIPVMETALLCSKAALRRYQ